jgi:molecular chaperone GrpE
VKLFEELKMIENTEEKQPVENEELMSQETVNEAVGEAVDEIVEETVVLKVSEHEKLLKDLADSKEKYVRLVAEFDNARKRSDRERSEFVKYANEGLVADFLTIMDDFRSRGDCSQRESSGLSSVS